MCPLTFIPTPTAMRISPLFTFDTFLPFTYWIPAIRLAQPPGYQVDPAAMVFGAVLGHSCRRGRDTHKSRGVRPVCLAMRDSITGPISIPS